ncbi:AT-rich interactive domain-containing protein 4-like isoform X2 [Phragmites australis]|uniref:AT-rich interactive domain-containing protein 4-like isoform X2 n=1 Tax=Phragmites australis TaxID=29695 RepID=UPI002D76AD1F|nr:AT-rich interactive domain-containing protein 4-like isoform X2 [Phragmites australis]
MSQIQSFSRNNCVLLAVLCGKHADKRVPARVGPEAKRLRPSYPFPELSSAGRLEVHTLFNPTPEQFLEAQRVVQPNFLYIQGQQLDDEKEIGSLVWGDADVSDPQAFSSLISPPFPTIVYLEVPIGEKLAQAVHTKGIPYVIYWRNSFSSYAASHFRHALMSVIQSSVSHTWDAFQLAHASFRLYCVRNNHVQSVKLGPRLLGDAPKINICPPENEMAEEEGSSEGFPAIKIYDEEINMKFLLCGVPCTLDPCLLGSLEDGLNALLNIEIRGSKLQNRVSASPPPLEAASLPRGMVTMRCDISTCSSSHVSLLVSGSAQTCFDDQLLESHIKNEIIEKSQLVRALSNSEDKLSSSEPLISMSTACGASTFEVWMSLPKWAAQVLKHLAPEMSYRSLVALGIGCINGTPVASFERQDADRLLFFCTGQRKDLATENGPHFHLPRWSASLTKDRTKVGSESKPNLIGANGVLEDKKHLTEGPSSFPSIKSKLKPATMRPIPRSRKQQMHPFMGFPEATVHEASQIKLNLPVAPPVKHSLAPAAPTTHRKSTSGSSHTQSVIQLNPLPMKKHGCDRLPIQMCSEEDFLKDVMQFLIQRGHNRLVPHGGLAEFPDAILNAKRLDLYNLYKEVVSRGGFYVGNGINWKGQVFSKMRNHTATNRMTGVGNTLKRHYETYLLEYELAHDDVDGECCLLCHSSAPGDWVNCGLCGEWAHFGCDRRQGLGTFKDYAKTDGLEYICPHCSLANYKKKLPQPPKVANGFANAATVSRNA